MYFTDPFPTIYLHIKIAKRSSRELKKTFLYMPVLSTIQPKPVISGCV